MRVREEIMNDKDSFINGEGYLEEIKRGLTPEREAELRTHLKTCESNLSQCGLCHELYENIGHERYVQALTEGM
jgi:hypothetical protein